MTFDEHFLSHIGGIRNNDLNNILHTNEFDSVELQTTRRSSYYDLDSFDKLTSSTNKCFSILSTNIQSINAKFNELEAFVEDLVNTISNSASSVYRKRVYLIMTICVFFLCQVMTVCPRVNIVVVKVV